MKFKLFGKTFEFKNVTSTMPALSSDTAWANYLSGQGYSVSAETALKVAAVFRCVDLVSKTMASLPLHLYEETPTGKEKAKAHPVYEIIHSLPNKYTTAYDFWQMFITNLLLTRGGYAKIERDKYRGTITALWNIPTGAVDGIKTNSVNGERYIDVRLGNGETERLRDGEFFYVPNFRFTSDKDPENPMNIAADVLGLSNDMNTYAAATFRQGVNPGGFIESPAGLSEQAYTRLKEDFNRNYAGVLNTGKFIILEEGSKANTFTRDMEKTQNLDSRRFAITEICRIFGVPVHLCMSMENATFSNIEQQSREYVRDCINPMSVRLEQAMYKDLLTTSERKTYYAKFATNGLLRGDTAAQTAYYNAMRQNGILNADEIRELEEMNKIPGGMGELYLINGNMITLENAKLNVPKGAQNQLKQEAK